MRVNYKLENGSIQIKEVPDEASPEQYKYGILIGPPDLSGLSLTNRQIKQLSSELALKGFGDYSDTQGRRSELLDIIRTVLNKRDKNLLKQILEIYQAEYFGG